MERKENSAQPELVSRLETVVRARYPEGVVRRLERQFKGSDRLAEDAVADAVAIMVRQADRLEVDDVESYLSALAINEMKRALRRLRREGFAEDEGVETGTEDEVLSRESLSYMKALVRDWENAGMRAAVSIELDAAFVGERLTTAELVHLLEQALDEEVTRATARKWKERGLDRLANRLVELGFVEERS